MNRRVSPASKKDFWDKLGSMSSIASLIGGLLIASVGAFFTYVYNNKQNELKEIETLEKFVLHLNGPPESQQVAIVSIFTLGDRDLAFRLASNLNNKQALQSLLWTSIKTDDYDLFAKILQTSLEISTLRDSTVGSVLTLACSVGNHKLIDLLLKKYKRELNSDYDYKTALNFGHDHKTPVMIAAEHGYGPVVKLLASEGADIRQSDELFGSALNLAASNGHYDAVKHLIEKGVDLETPSFIDYSPLMQATAGGHLEVVNLLLQSGCDPNSNTGSWVHDAKNSLMIAARDGNIEIVKTLLKYKADVDIIGDTHKNAFMWALEANNDVIARLLADNGADIPRSLLNSSNYGYDLIFENLIRLGFDKRLSKGELERLLIDAASEGDYELVDFLLTKGVSVKSKNETGDSALLIATRQSDFSNTELLLRHGADVNLSNKLGETPLYFAIKNSNRPILDLLLKNGADSKRPTVYGWTPAMFAYFMKETSIHRAFEEMGILTDHRIEMDLCHAIFDGRRDKVLSCLNSGADINFRTIRGATPLIFACMKDRREIVRLLIQKGAKIDPIVVRDSGIESSAVSLAIEESNFETVKLLMEKQVNKSSYLRQLGGSYVNVFDFAAKSNNLQLVEYVVEADPSCVVAKSPSDGTNAVHRLLDDANTLYEKTNGIDFYFKCLQVAISSGAETNSVDNEGVTPLMMAAQVADDRFVNLLLDNGALINQRDKKGNTALMHAAMWNRANVMKALISRRAKVYSSNAEGKTIFELAPRHSSADSLLQAIRLSF